MQGSSYLLACSYILERILAILSSSFKQHYIGQITHSPFHCKFQNEWELHHIFFHFEFIFGKSQASWRLTSVIPDFRQHCYKLESIDIKIYVHQLQTY